jgi:hypothetical protein
MKFNKWTLGLAAVGVVSLASAVQAEERDNPVMTALSSTAISGYVDTAAVWRLGNNGGAGAGILVPGMASTDNKADIFNLNAVGLTLEKPLDEAEWSAGYKVDLVFGPDIVGWNPSVNAGGLPQDVGIKQAYIELRVPVGNGLDFKLGTFDTIIGFEAFEAYKNPHWTRSYGWQIEPTAHTGALMSYRFNDIIAVQAGIANTAASGINNRPVRVDSVTGFPIPVSETEKTYMGGVTLTAPESLGFLAGSTLNLGVVNGLRGNIADNTWLYAGGTFNTPLEGLKLGAAFDAVYGDSVGPVSQGYAYTIAGYVMYQATEKLKLAGRLDYAKGSTGTWYASNEVPGVNAGNPMNRLLGVTGTLDYSLWENVITRLEFRWDRDLTDQHQNGPFGFDDNNNYLLALNVIYRF